MEEAGNNKNNSNYNRERAETSQKKRRGEDI